MAHDTAFQIANAIALVGWLALLASPLRPQLADRVSGFLIPSLLATAYGLLFVSSWNGMDGGFGSLEQVTRLFSQPEAVLVGWIHYLAFDLFVGGWEVRTARREAIPFVLVIPCLLLTFMLGPVGFLLFMIIRLGPRPRWSGPSRSQGSRS